MTHKFKFRVFVTKYCRGCKKKHEFPTNRYIFRQLEGDAVDTTRQKAHVYLVGMLEHENRNDKDKKRQQRPLWQYDIEVA